MGNALFSSSSPPTRKVPFGFLDGDRVGLVPYASTEYSGPSHARMASQATVLSKDELLNRIRGVVYGQALGDSIGLATEFMDKEAIKAAYGESPVYAHGSFREDGHRGKWLAGEWTDDTDQMLLIFDSYLASGGLASPKDFAARLRYWSRYSVPGMRGRGLGMTVGTVIEVPGFLDEPHEAARRVWEAGDRKQAANGAVMRTGITGIVHFGDPSSVWEDTLAYCNTTHADPRCQASSVMVALAIAAFLRGESDRRAVTLACLEQALVLLKDNDAHLQELKDHVLATSLEHLNLGGNKAIGYTLKCVGAAFVSLNSGDDFEMAITRLTNEGGDADTNGAVAGALLGAAVGYTGLPERWLSTLANKEFLEERIDRLWQLMTANE